MPATTIQDTARWSSQVLSISASGETSNAEDAEIIVSGQRLQDGATQNVPPRRSG
ncbi:MAG: hypothetical protein RIK87_17760 [Fuerstiella sp.]